MNDTENLLSENLRKTRNKLADFRHGGVVLPSDEVEELVQRMDCFVDAAEAIEQALATFRPIDPADLKRIVPARSANVLHLMRPGTNIVPFPGKPHA